MAMNTIAHPVTIVSWSEFTNNPSMMHGLFQNTPGRLVYDNSQVMCLLGTGDETGSKKARTLKVETVEELIQLRNDFMSKPVLFATTLKYRRRRHYVFVRVNIITKGTFAVLLNTKHPAIAAKINVIFEEAREIILQGKKFCLEIDLTDVLENWYENLLREDDLDDCNGYTRSNGTHIYITNQSPYQHCFDCNRIWALTCCLCWCLSAPCYMGVRACTTKDLACSFDRNTPIVYRTTTRVPGQLLEVLSPGHTMQAVGQIPIEVQQQAPGYNYGPMPQAGAPPAYQPQPQATPRQPQHATAQGYTQGQPQQATAPQPQNTYQQQVYTNQPRSAAAASNQWPQHQGAEQPADGYQAGPPPAYTSK